MLDRPVFKVLAHNDTGGAKGHQGGIVIPKDIAAFFPLLEARGTTLVPTDDKRLSAELFVDGQFVGNADTRFQHQTWGGSRSPERRLTDNLGPLRNKASAGDLVLFMKDLEDDDRLQVHLFRKGTVDFARLAEIAGNRRWGILEPLERPVSIAEIVTAESEADQTGDGPAEVFRKDQARTESRTMRLARERAFRRRVLEAYGERCAVTGRSFALPSGANGLDAAHIVPVGRTGSDHPANGIALSKDFHWAFDRGMFGLTSELSVIVPEVVRRIPGNEFLADVQGRRILAASPQNHAPSSVAVAWHRENILLR